MNKEIKVGGLKHQYDKEFVPTQEYLDSMPDIQNSGFIGKPIDFVGVHNTYESLMADVLDYSLENEECDFDFVELDNELRDKFMNNQEAACFIFCDGTGESCVFDFEQFNMIAEWDIEMHLKSVLGEDIDSEDIVDVLDVFFDLFDDEKLEVEGYDDVCEYLFKHHDLFNCVDFKSFVRSYYPLYGFRRSGNYLVDDD